MKIKPGFYHIRFLFSLKRQQTIIGTCTQVFDLPHQSTLKITTISTSIHHPSHHLSRRHYHPCSNPEITNQITLKDQSKGFKTSKGFINECLGRLPRLRVLRRFVCKCQRMFYTVHRDWGRVARHVFGQIKNWFVSSPVGRCVIRLDKSSEIV